MIFGRGNTISTYCGKKSLTRGDPWSGKKYEYRTPDRTPVLLVLAHARRGKKVSWKILLENSNRTPRFPTDALVLSIQYLQEVLQKRACWSWCMRYCTPNCSMEQVFFWPTLFARNDYCPESIYFGRVSEGWKLVKIGTNGVKTCILHRVIRWGRYHVLRYSNTTLSKCQCLETTPRKEGFRITTTECTNCSLYPSHYLLSVLRM
jgi:hypothetical protein